LVAQQIDNQERSLTCSDSSRRWGRDQNERFCEMREYTLPNVARVSVDGHINGGINVKGWSRNDVLVRAQVSTWAASESEARSMSGQVNVHSSGGNIRADAPDFGRERGWAVAYEVFVPHATGLTLKAHNGGIAIADVVGDIQFEALNGGISLKRLGGFVEGKTTNGGLNIELAGARWQGREMNVSATNGGVSVKVPENYAANFETSTVNGRISTDFPINVSGRIDRQLAFQTGGGGPRIRAVTVNGGVSIQRR
jgi:DUF4097 and DUF4098 domain-containing protein YvlB